MPCQVICQFVAIKLQPSVHALGAEAAVATEAAVGTTSAADASSPQEATPAAMITAAKNAELCTASLPGSTCTIVSLYKAGRQESTGAVCSDARKFRSEWQPRHSLKSPWPCRREFHVVRFVALDGASPLVPRSFSAPAISPF